MLFNPNTSNEKQIELPFRMETVKVFGHNPNTGMLYIHYILSNTHVLSVQMHFGVIVFRMIVENCIKLTKF